MTSVREKKWLWREIIWEREFMSLKRRVKWLVIPVILSLFSALPTAAATVVCRSGHQVEVFRNGVWLPATALRSRGNDCYIQYVGPGPIWSEWVGPGNFRYYGPPADTAVVGVPFYYVGDPVYVWRYRTWYPATVLEVGPHHWRVRYDDHGPKWDEWVGIKRIKRR